MGSRTCGPLSQLIRKTCMLLVASTHQAVSSTSGISRELRGREGSPRALGKWVKVRMRMRIGDVQGNKLRCSPPAQGWAGRTGQME